jgi:hypothetical protein
MILLLISLKISLSIYTINFHLSISKSSKDKESSWQQFYADIWYIILLIHILIQQTHKLL